MEDKQPIQKKEEEETPNCLIKNFQIPTLSLKAGAVICIFVGLIFISVAIPMFIAIISVQQASYLYYDPSNKSACNIGENCVMNITINNDLTAPVYLLYQLDNFYQNHRKYIQSKSNYQLAGNQISVGSQSSICTPYITNKDMGKTISWGNHSLDPDAVANPCGSIAYTFFDDEYSLKNSNNENIDIKQSDITWPGEKGKKYRKSENSEKTQWINPQNEHFIVWMQTSGLPNFKKLWGVIESDLTAGTYELTVKNNFNSTNWEGQRYVVLTTNSMFGGKNFTLPCFILICGVFCFVACGLLLIKRKKLFQLKRRQE